MNRVTVRNLGIAFSVQCSSVTVCAVLLVSVLCCLQVAFNNMRMFLMHIITLENNLKCVLFCGYFIQVVLFHLPMTLLPYEKRHISRIYITRLPYIILIQITHLPYKITLYPIITFDRFLILPIMLSSYKLTCACS